MIQNCNIFYLETSLSKENYTICILIEITLIDIKKHFFSCVFSRALKITECPNEEIN